MDKQCASCHSYASASAEKCDECGESFGPRPSSAVDLKVYAPTQVSVLPPELLAAAPPWGTGREPAARPGATPTPTTGSGLELETTRPSVAAAVAPPRGEALRATRRRPAGSRFRGVLALLVLVVAGGAYVGRGKLDSVRRSLLPPVPAATPPATTPKETPRVVVVPHPPATPAPTPVMTIARVAAMPTPLPILTVVRLASAPTPRAATPTLTPRARVTAPTPAPTRVADAANPLEAEALRMANARMQAGDYDGALTDLKAILKLHSDNADARYALAVVYSLKGEDGKACKELARYLATAPDGKYAATARQSSANCGD